MKDGEEEVIKKRKKEEGGCLEEKKPKKNGLPKPGTLAMTSHRPEKKKRKKLMKDPLHLATEKRKKSHSPVQGENGLAGAGAEAGQKAWPGALGDGQGTSPLEPLPLPDNLPGPLLKRIADLHLASRQFDQEGRKKFFTLDVYNILLDIEKKLQEQPIVVRIAVYSHLEAFVPCRKGVLLRRMKMVRLKIKDDRLRTPLLKLKLAVCSVMPEQITSHNMHCIPRFAIHQDEEVENNGSGDDDQENPGKGVKARRKKFFWDDELKTLLYNVVRVKLDCYLQDPETPVSVEDYLKDFLETEVKPLWPKGWMQTRILYKVSCYVHGHLTDNPVEKKMVPAPESKPKQVQEDTWVPSLPLPKTTCLSDSLDDDQPPSSPDSMSHTLAQLSSTAKGLIRDCVTSLKPSPPAPTPGKKAAPCEGSQALSSPAVSEAPKGGGGAGAPPPQAERHPPALTTSNECQSSGSPAPAASPLPPKPRPPPTTSPLMPPQQKAFSSPGLKQGVRSGLNTPHSELEKGSSKARSSRNGSMSVTQCRSNALSSPQSSPSLPHTARPLQTHLKTPPQASPASSPSPSASPGPAPVPSSEAMSH